jgi:hypothetical protein
MQAMDCGGSIKDYGGDTSERQCILRGLVSIRVGKPHFYRL